MTDDKKKRMHQWIDTRRPKGNWAGGFSFVSITRSRDKGRTEKEMWLHFTLPDTHQNCHEILNRQQCFLDNFDKIKACINNAITFPQTFFRLPIEQRVVWNSQ